jgi:hypothetical protein
VRSEGEETGKWGKDRREGAMERRPREEEPGEEGHWGNPVR